MNNYKTAFVITALLSFLLPAAAAECTPDLDSISCSDQVKHAMNSTRILLARSSINDVLVTPFAVSPKKPAEVLHKSVSFLEEGGTMRWLYSTVDQRRILATFIGSQGGRPAELRVKVRLRLL